MARGVKVDARIERVHEMISFMRRVQGADMRAAMARGLSEHAEEQRRQSIVRITNFTGIPAGRISSKTKVIKARPSALMEARIENRDQAISLGEYGAPTWSRSMAGASATAWNKRHTFPGTFVANGEVYVRRTKKRLPLNKLFGPVIPNELAKPSRPNVPAAQAYLAMDLEKRVTRHIIVALGT
jgi:hypothetical protein